MAKDLYNMDRHTKSTTYQILFFERADLEPGRLYPNNHPKRALVDLCTGRDNGNYPRYLEIAHSLFVQGYWWGRMDICMINEWHAHKPKGQRAGNQWVLDPYYDDKQMQQTKVWKFLNKAQRAECLRLRDELVEAERKYGFPRGTLLS